MKLLDLAVIFSALSWLCVASSQDYYTQSEENNSEQDDENENYNDDVDNYDIDTSDEDGDEEINNIYGKNHNWRAGRKLTSFPCVDNSLGDGKTGRNGSWRNTKKFCSRPKP